MRNNKGFSLVELLIAVAIASIIAGSVAYLLVTSLRMYNNETTNTTLQQELQVTLNQIVDYAMESKTLVVDNSSGETSYVVFGTVNKADRTKLDAQILWKDGDRLYLRKEVISNYKDDTDGNKLVDKVEEFVPALSSTGATSDTKYILADYISKFEVIPSGYTKGKDSNNDDMYYYENPLSVDISLSFSKKGSGKIITKNVSDKAVFRNRVTDLIYIDRDREPYVLLDLIALSEEKTNVALEGSAANPGAATEYVILDIAPSKAYAAMPFMAKEGFDYLDSYFKDELGLRCTAAQAFDAYVNRTTGTVNGSTGEDERVRDSDIFSNNGVGNNSYALYTNYNNKNAGYYEYVGKNKGLFAVRSNSYKDITYTAFNYIKPSDAKSGAIYCGVQSTSTSGLKDYIKKSGYAYTKVGTNQGNYEKTITKYTPREADDDMLDGFISVPSGDYDITATPKSGGDYIVRSRTYYTYVGPGAGGNVSLSWTQDAGQGNGEYSKVTRNGVEQYVFVGPGKGRYNLYTYGDASGVYKSVTGQEIIQVGTGNGTHIVSAVEKRGTGHYIAADIDIYSFVDWGHGSYTRKNVDYYVYKGEGKGDYSITFSTPNNYSEYYCYRFDENSDIKNVIMQSIYSKDARKNDGLDYGWIWVDSPIKPTSGKDFTYNKYTEGDTISLKNYWRSKVINNELLKLFVFQKDCERYTPDGKIDVTHGVWDPDKNAYVDLNKNAVDQFDENIYLKFIVKAPNELTNDDIAQADFIMFESKVEGSTEYNCREFFYPFIKSDMRDASYGEDNDITFRQALMIYDQVVATKQTAIACPYTGMPELMKSSNSNVPLNMAKLWFMLYGVVDRTETSADVKALAEEHKTDYSAMDSNYDTSVVYTVQGSGREMFLEYLTKYDDLAHTYPSPTAGYKTSNFVRINEEGDINIIGTRDGSAPQVYDDPLYDGYNNPEWGYGVGIDKTYNTLLCLRNQLSGYDTNYLQMQSDTSKGSKWVYNHMYYDHNILYDPVNSSNHSYLYSMTSGNIGVYKNQMLYGTGSTIFRFMNSGRSGSDPSLLWMQKVVDARDGSKTPTIKIYISAAKDDSTPAKVDRTWSASDPKNKRLEYNEFDDIGDITISYYATCTQPITKIEIENLNTGEKATITPGANYYNGSFLAECKDGKTGVLGVKVTAIWSQGKNTVSDSDECSIVVRDLFDLD